MPGVDCQHPREHPGASCPGLFSLKCFPQPLRGLERGPTDLIECVFWPHSPLEDEVVPLARAAAPEAQPRKLEAGGKPEESCGGCSSLRALSLPLAVL